MATDFPKKGDDLKISLRNSEYPQFDHDFASNLKDNNPEIWELGGNIRGNEAFNLWSRARDGAETEGVLDWIKEREAWAARHFEDGSQFSSGDLEPTRSNVAGVVAQIKWGVIGTLGEQKMKDTILELIKKLEGKKEERAISDLTDTARTGLENKVEEHNEEYGDTETKRVTLGMLGQKCISAALAHTKRTRLRFAQAFNQPNSGLWPASILCFLHCEMSDSKADNTTPIYSRRAIH